MTRNKVNKFYDTGNTELEIYTHLNDNAIIEDQEYGEQETEIIHHPCMNENIPFKELENMKQNTTKEIATQEAIFNPETEQADINSMQSRHKTYMRSKFEIQCSRLLPVSPQIIAQKLFQHWEKQLNFNEDIHKANNDTFIIQTVNELTNLAQKATP